MYGLTKKKSHSTNCFLLLLVLLACFCLVPSSALSANEPVGKVVRVDGVVHLERAGKTWQGQVGEDVQLRDLFKTEQDSRAEILFVDDSRVRIAPGTELEITEYLYKPEQKKRKSTLSLWSGKARFIVNKLADFVQKDFEVQTPSGTAGVRGTDFIVEVKKKKPEQTARQ
jgi:hypothetical protein